MGGAEAAARDADRGADEQAAEEQREVDRHALAQHVGRPAAGRVRGAHSGCARGRAAGGSRRPRVSPRSNRRNVSPRYAGVLVIASPSGTSSTGRGDQDVAERDGREHGRDQHPHPAQHPHALVMADSRVVLSPDHFLMTSSVEPLSDHFSATSRSPSAWPTTSAPACWRPASGCRPSATSRARSRSAARRCARRSRRCRSRAWSRRATARARSSSALPPVDERAARRQPVRRARGAARARARRRPAGRRARPARRGRREAARGDGGRAGGHRHLERLRPPLSPPARGDDRQPGPARVRRPRRVADGPAAVAAAARRLDRRSPAARASTSPSTA